MPPKKPDPKDVKKPAGGAGQAFVEDDYSDLASLPPLNNYIFTTLSSFKYKRNWSRVQQNLLKQYSYPPEDTGSGLKIKTIQRDDILNYARAKQYITEEELAAALVGDALKVLGSQERVTEIFAKTTVDLILSHEVPLRRIKKEQPADGSEQAQDVELTIWLKDFPATLSDFKALFALKQGIHGLYLLEEKFRPEEVDDYSLPPSSTLSVSASQAQLQVEEQKKKLEDK